jgi:hypothetical protein
MTIDASVVPSLVGAVIGATIGTVIGQRRVVTKHMPAVAAPWFALSFGERLRIRWAVARGTAVDDARLAPLAVAYTRMRQAMVARFTAWKLALFVVICAGVAVACVVVMKGLGLVFAAVIATSLLCEVIARPGRAARLRRAEQRNLAAAAPG